MLTSGTKSEDGEVARQAGANDYIVKPFSADTLKQKLQGFVMA